MGAGRSELFDCIMGRHRHAERARSSSTASTVKERDVDRPHRAAAWR